MSLFAWVCKPGGPNESLFASFSKPGGPKVSLFVWVCKPGGLNESGSLGLVRLILAWDCIFVDIYMGL